MRRAERRKRLKAHRRREAGHVMSTFRKRFYAALDAYTEGEVSACICEQCGKKVRTRFERRTFPLVRPEGDVPDVLVSVCEECDKIVGVPGQSLRRIAEFREASRQHI